MKAKENKTKMIQDPDMFFMRSQVLRLMELALQINETTSYAIFIDYAGHVNQIEIRIADSKRDYQDWSYQKSLYLNTVIEPSYKHINIELKSILTHLENLLK